MIKLEFLLQAYAVEPRSNWVIDWPGQVVLCASQAYWTREVHEAIRVGPGGLKDYYGALCKQLGDVVELVRGKLTKQARTTLGALVVIDVHARDAVLEMVEKGRVVFFSWEISHLKLAWHFWLFMEHIIFWILSWTILFDAIPDKVVLNRTNGFIMNLMICWYSVYDIGMINIPKPNVSNDLKKSSLWW